MKNRLGIFAFYDKHGIVDESVIFLLECFKKFFAKLIIVCNGQIEDNELIKLKYFSDAVFIRENQGFDIGAYKTALLNYIGWNDLRNYNELVLFNSTFFGPFYDFETVFLDMEARNLDFWGLTKHGSMRLGEYKVTPHVQSYFMVIEERLLHSQDFFDFWISRKEGLEDIVEVIDNFELSFTRIFQNKGYLWDAYVDTKELDGENIEENFNPLVYLPYTLLNEFKLPVLKKRLWPWTFADKGLSYEYPMALRYIEENLNYNMNFIYNYLIRTQDLLELITVLQLNFVLPDKHDLSSEFEERKGKAVILIYLLYENNYEYFQSYIRRLDRKWDVCFLKGSEKASRLFIEQYEDIAKKYEYIIFLHDFDIAHNKRIQGKSLNFWACENLIKSKSYVNNLIGILAENDRIGLLCPPVPAFKAIINGDCEEWFYKAEELRKLTRKIPLKCPISESSYPCTWGSVFACKSKAIGGLLKYKKYLKENMDSNISETLFGWLVGYLVQEQGYLVGQVSNPNYASINMTNLTFLYKECRKALLDNDQKF